MAQKISPNTVGRKYSFFSCKILISTRPVVRSCTSIRPKPNKHVTRGNKALIGPKT
jgi:hypothetical protein